MLQGLFVGLTFIAFPVWLTSQGMSTDSVATFAAITTLPLTLKVVAGPFMDRFTFAPMGMRRPWILALQVPLCAACCALFSVSNVSQQFWLLLGICTAMNAFAFAGDVAVDGLAVLIIPERERGRANAFMTAGLVTGMSVVTAVSTPLLDLGGVPALGLFLASCTGITFMMSVAIRERPSDRVFPWSRGSGSPEEGRSEASMASLVRHLYKAMVLPMNLLMLCVMFLHRATYGVYKVWAPEMGVNAFGYSDAEYTGWNAIALLCCAVLGLAVGPLIDRLGGRRAYSLALLTAGVGYAALYPIANFLADPRVAVGSMFVLEAIDTMTFITFLAIAMSLCREEISATQFACYMALGNLGTVAGSAVYPSLARWTGVFEVFLANAGAYIACWALMTRFSFDRQKQLRTGEGEPEA